MTEICCELLNDIIFEASCKYLETFVNGTNYYFEIAPALE